jgi:hypothetical protein
LFDFFKDHSLFKKEGKINIDIQIIAKDKLAKDKLPSTPSFSYFRTLNFYNCKRLTDDINYMYLIEREEKGYNYHGLDKAIPLRINIINSENGMKMRGLDKEIVDQIDKEILDLLLSNIDSLEEELSRHPGGRYNLKYSLPIPISHIEILRLINE